MSEALDAQLRLRREALAHYPLFSGDAAATETKLRAAMTPAHETGTVHVLRAGGCIAGVLAWRRDESPREGAPISHVLIDYIPGHPAAAAWLGECLDAELPRMEADLSLFVERCYPEAYRALRAREVGIDSVCLLGDPRVAQQRLRADRPVMPLPDGVALAPLEASHIEGILALQVDVFRDHPQHGWFVANPAFLDFCRRKVARELATPAPCHFAVLDDGRFAGHVSAFVDDDDPYWGPTAGMSLLLSAPLRGRGLLRPIYDALLTAMIERGARTFVGSTSQPPVLHLSRIMGRYARGLSMRRAAAFDEAHFAPYAPIFGDAPRR